MQLHPCPSDLRAVPKADRVRPGGGSQKECQFSVPLTRILCGVGEGGSVVKAVRRSGRDVLATSILRGGYGLMPLRVVRFPSWRQMIVFSASCGGGSVPPATLLVRVLGAAQLGAAVRHDTCNDTCYLEPPVRWPCFPEG